jgi:hypothetical protein
MPIRFAKPAPNRAPQARIAEVNQALDSFVRAVAPAVQRAGTDMGRSLRKAAKRPTT